MLKKWFYDKMEYVNCEILADAEKKKLCFMLFAYNTE